MSGYTLGAKRTEDTQHRKDGKHKWEVVISSWVHLRLEQLLIHLITSNKCRMVGSRALHASKYERAHIMCYLSTRPQFIITRCNFHWGIRTRISLSFSWANQFWLRFFLIPHYCFTAVLLIASSLRSVAGVEMTVAACVECMYECVSNFKRGNKRARDGLYVRRISRRWLYK